MAKKNESVMAVADLHEQFDALWADNAELMNENNALRKENDRLMKDFIRMEDRYGEEHQKRMRERNDAYKVIEELRTKVKIYATWLEDAQGIRAGEKSKRQASVIKFVIVSAIAVVLLLVPCALQRWGIIGPQLSYAIECSLMMVIAWCYALIWDRSKK